MTRRAACSCGQLHLTCEGEPVRVSMCHCLECQRRTGAVFGNQAWFEKQQITVSGSSTKFSRSSDGGRWVSFQFCPLRLDRLLGGGGISRHDRSRGGLIRRPCFPRAQVFRLGAATAQLG